LFCATLRMDSKAYLRDKYECYNRDVIENIEQCKGKNATQERKN